MATYWVSTTGDDADPGSQAAPFATIGHAFDQVVQGDTVNIINDGVHDALAFGDMLQLMGNFVGTNYTTDFGLRIRGTDSSGNPALTKIKVPAADPTKKYFIRLDYDSNYVSIEGFHFDWSEAEADNQSSTYGILGGREPALNTRLLGCVIEILPRGASSSWTRTGWFLSVSFTNSGVQATKGTYEIAHCYFINAGVRFLTTGNMHSNYHHNVFIYDASEVATGVGYIVSGGSAFYANSEYTFHNNTLLRIFNKAGADSDVIGTCAGTTLANIVFHSNIYVNIAEPTSTGEVENIQLVGLPSADHTTGPGVFDHSLWGWLGTYDATNLFVSSGGYGNYTFNPDWRDDGSPTTASTTLAPDDEAVFGDDVTDVFNAATTWVWSTDAGYDIPLPYDFRPVVGRTVAVGGGPAGAIMEPINAAPVVGDWNGAFSPEEVTAGDTVSVTAGDGLDTVCSDDDGDSLTYFVIDDVTHGALTLSTDGSFSYIPSTTYVGPDSFTFEACDGTTCTSFLPDSTTNPSVFFSVLNATPIITGDLSFTVNENQVLSVNAASGLLSNASDPEGLTITATNASTPSNGAVTFNTTTGSFQYAPDTWFSGDDSFTYEVTDGVNSVTGTVNIEVLEAVSPPDSDVIDTAPFFRPTLEVTTEFRMKGKKNRRKHHDLANYTEKVQWNESLHRIINLGTNTTTQITLGGVADGEYLLVETDNDINVSINGAGNYWPVSEVVAVALTSVTSLYLQNESTSDTAQVILVVAD